MHQSIDFIGIGVGKSGTTTVARWLEAHPDICLSVPKEVNYFHTYNNYRFKQKKNQYRQKPITWYLRHFSHCKVDSIKGEFCPNYFIDSDAPRNIHQRFPDVKLIACLRNPTHRAYSHYQMLYNFHLTEKRDFSAVIRSEPEYIQKGLYFQNLTNYLRYFDLNQMLILSFEEIKNNPIQTVKKLYSFLEVENAFIPPNIHQKANSSKKARSKWLKDFEINMVNTVSGLGGAGIIQFLKKMNVHRLVHRLNTNPYSYPPMKEEDKEWLKQQFQSDIELLEKLLNRDFSYWK